MRYIFPFLFVSTTNDPFFPFSFFYFSLYNTHIFLVAPLLSSLSLQSQIFLHYCTVLYCASSRSHMSFLLEHRNLYGYLFPFSFMEMSRTIKKWWFIYMTRTSLHLSVHNLLGQELKGEIIYLCFLPTTSRRVCGHISVHPIMHMAFFSVMEAS